MEVLEKLWSLLIRQYYGLMADIIFKQTMNWIATGF